MTTITDEFMRQMMTSTRPYTLVILKTRPGRSEAGADAIIWEHGRRNFELRARGLLLIVCPIRDGSDTAGIGIFNASPAEVEQLMAEDPAIKADILSYEIHATRSFPGDCLAGA
ncbi:MAG TPA: hypothetical protein VHD63_02175 [Ktedonobacteraceae bacterium]|nr:hypothetical protein [Ktedonobacteraceae bacterium]